MAAGQRASGQKPGRRPGGRVPSCARRSAAIPSPPQKTAAHAGSDKSSADYFTPSFSRCGRGIVPRIPNRLVRSASALTLRAASRANRANTTEAREVPLGLETRLAASV